ncbi:MinD/ParA family protein [Evansella sp. AB-P1]|uniref:MinD/ParA family protein n=1 Tax=Evansella sp. AB-P1 TaxID=3037653 RepID=UPI00241EDBA1|nr:MinD/ParA family protein [Evansella sp. AB-P1]MDG5788171.1 MinD/ParA family protein [Evansella sp. AB-P1]
MKDQADVLRNKMMQFQDRSNENNIKNTKVIAVVSGKGGVGKSNISVNFSLALQKLGKNVIIFDLDIGMANIDILLGKTTNFSIVDMLEKGFTIWDIIETGQEGLSFISGGTGLTELFQMTEEKMNYFLEQLSQLGQKYDYILFDMGAGISQSSIHFLLSVNELFLVTTPEPTSITDAYAMIKHINSQSNAIPIHLIVNRAKHKNDGVNTARNLSSVCLQFLNKEISHIATLPDDEIVWKGVRSQVPFILMSPKSKPSIAIHQAALQFIKNDGTKIMDEKVSLNTFVSKLKYLFQR